MLSLSFCPFCIRAKNILKKENIPFDSFEIDQGEISSELKNEFQKKTNHYTFPSIFFGNQFIGGNDDLMNLINNKELII